MASQPDPALPPADLPAELDALRADRDRWRARAEEAESELHRVTDELSRTQEAVEGDLGIFGQDALPSRGVRADGSDPRVLAVALLAVGVVMAMVTALSALNNGLASVTTVVMLLVTAALLWGAWNSRVQPPSVAVVRHMVLIENRGQTHRFDLREASTRLEVVGSPSDASWSVSFLRRGLSPITIDASMVDPYDFMTRLRAYRPEL